MTSTNTTRNNKRFGNVIAYGIAAKLSIFSVFLIYMMRSQVMTRQEKIKAAEERIKELETLIKHFKKQNLSLTDKLINQRIRNKFYINETYLILIYVFFKPLPLAVMETDSDQIDINEKPIKVSANDVKIKSSSVNFISLCSQRTIHLVLVRSLVWSRNQTANTPFPHHS